MTPRAAHLFVALFMVLVPAGPLWAQAEELGRQSLGRPYAYAIGWALILGWVVAIARRLRRVEDRLRQNGE